jgi:hypothetical protein
MRSFDNFVSRLHTLKKAEGSLANLNSKFGKNYRD